jgi:uncharacterized phage-like protein YoqJ
MIVAFTGHRPDKIDARINQVSDAIQKFLEENKPKHVVIGMADGVDLLAGAWARRLAIPYTAAIPFRDHVPSYDSVRSGHYHQILKDASKIEFICEGPYAVWKYQKRNEWMVDHSDLLAAVWDNSPGGTANCINYAKQVGKDIRYLEWL